MTLYGVGRCALYGQHDLLWSWAVCLIWGSTTLYGVGRYGLIWGWVVWPSMVLGWLAPHVGGMFGRPLPWGVWRLMVLGGVVSRGVGM